MKHIAAVGFVVFAALAGAQDGVVVDPGRDGPTGAPPSDWQPIALTHSKTPTTYRVERIGDHVALHALANAAASAIGYPVHIDVHQLPLVSWEWKPISAIEGADNHVAAHEDAALRLIFSFDGDRHHLALSDRVALSAAHALAGTDLPYATLMYMWVPHGKLDEVIANPHTNRVEMLVTDTADPDGSWHKLKRNILEDYRRIFHEEPGALTAIGVMTDTDNTGGNVEAWYGNIRFDAAP
jgi:hypothetical protein